MSALKILLLITCAPLDIFFYNLNNLTCIKIIEEITACKKMLYDKERNNQMKYGVSVSSHTFFPDKNETRIKGFSQF